MEVVHRFWGRLRSNDFGWAFQLLGDDFVLEWPQSRERIRGRAAFAATNEGDPRHRRWEFTVLRVVGNDDDAMSDVSATDGVQKAGAISFFSARGGRITALIEFWPEAYDPPANRSHLVERMVD